MGAGEELRGGKGSTNQDIVQETKNKGKIIKSKAAVRKEAEIYLQYPGRQGERSEVERASTPVPNCTT